MKVSNGNLVKQFKTAKDANVPLMAINTPDPTTTLAVIKSAYPNNVIVQWDVINGAQPVTSIASEPVNKMNRNPVDGSINPAMATGNPADLLTKVKELPALSIVVMFNAHMFTDKMQPGNLSAPVIQAIWNVRDFFRQKKSMLVLFAPEFPIPDELAHDVLVLDEQLPEGGELEGIIAKACTTAGVKKPGRKTMPTLVDATAGLAPFTVEQTIKMSVTRTRKATKIDIDQLWARKIANIQKEAGLKIHQRGPTFDDIGGNDNIKDYLRKVARSILRPRLVVFLDEIEKSMAAAGTDTSGVTTDQLKVLLTSMQDYLWTGMIIYGFPGTGKSQLSKAFGSEASALTVEADLGGMKHIWVGSSEARMRKFIKIIRAMGGEKVFFIATCNDISILRPELKRRFKHGIWFGDLPTKEEKEKIWQIYLRKFNLHNQERPDDTGWTGAEIEVCCDKAASFGITLKDACRFMTIVSHAMGDGLDKMRKAASGKYVSTLHPGVYTYNPNPEPLPEKQTFFGKKK